jgi:hypothetical protein
MAPLWVCALNYMVNKSNAQVLAHLLDIFVQVHVPHTWKKCSKYQKTLLPEPAWRLAVPVQAHPFGKTALSESKVQGDRQNHTAVAMAENNRSTHPPKSLFLA